MPRPRDIDYLQPDERIVAQQRRHPLSAVDAFLGWTILWLIVAGALALAALWVIDEVATILWTVAGMATAGYIIAMLVTHWRRATSLYVVTPQRVYGAYGRLRFNLTQTTYDKVTDLHLHQSLFGRVWGYGTVKVQTAGTGVALAGVQDPVAFKRRIEAERDAFLQELVAEHRGRRRPARPSRGDRGDPEILWTGSPSPATLIGAGVVAGIFALFGLGFLIGGAVAAWQLMLMGGGMVTLGGLIMFGAYIQFRYTAFDVTDEGVVLRRGWLSRRRVEATYAKVTDVAVAQNIIARLFGYGTITVNTAGSNEAPVSFAGVAGPDDVKQIIDDARRKADR